MTFLDDQTIARNRARSDTRAIADIVQIVADQGDTDWLHTSTIPVLMAMVDQPTRHTLINKTNRQCD